VLVQRSAATLFLALPLEQSKDAPGGSPERFRGCRGAGLSAFAARRRPSPAEKPNANQGALEYSQAPKLSTPFPGGRDAALHVRQGCLTLPARLEKNAPFFVALLSGDA
jgi:hypothetical protein